MPISQENRLLKLVTPLGPDVLVLRSFSASEGLSTLFHVYLELLHETPEGPPHQVDIQKLLGQPVGIQIEQQDKTTRYFHGICSRFSHGNRDSRYTYYRAEVVPQIWLLTRRAQSRIFQHITVPDILKKVFSGFDVTYEIQGTFHQRDYCVQYRETDFNFASRLMEEEGIYYYFEHTDDGHKMIVANTPQSHRECPEKSEVAFADEATQDQGFVSAVRSWEVNEQVQTGKYTLWDHCFELPHKHLEADKPTRFSVGNNNKLEVYDYPGGYAQRFDGVDKGGGVQANELQKIFEDNRRTVELRMQELDASYMMINGSSDCASLTAGCRFELTNHAASSYNGSYVLTGIQHSAEQSPQYDTEHHGRRPYTNSFTCIPLKVPFRPPRITPRPVVAGSQTAVVVGPSGEEIFVDKYGRVKVQFHWDREGQANADSSCWIRVSQNHAGLKWGSAYWPRIGQEVVVDFLEGDPDQPIIVGSVYNATELPPYDLPDEKTKTVLHKSNSYKGGGGFNELRFEDSKGKEQIFIHGQRNQDIRIKNDLFEWIGNETHLVVKKDQFELIEGDKHQGVKGDHNEKVDGTVSLKVGIDHEEKVGSKYALEAGTEIHLKSGANLVIESGATLTLKVGGNFININPAGIFIKGTMVMINSGGAAGSGSGASPETPTDPKEADTAEPGRVSQAPPATPAPQQPTFSPAALTLMQAAESGAPFCEICERYRQGLA
jgi:type VI secretion system secreted protein VgrG